ncbi:hypothetical protein H4R20_000446 [Coemansia guatemalensis]|uniref:Mitochondrial inner membrane protease subunit 2 n=1 Tax=Coemansia guatemalensis TaxID=2761395 RepID=A0A9W8LVU9_9FUNG|nr:hypothetical protein H4R20_000446 [Coemansia guatemalensis]
MSSATRLFRRRLVVGAVAAVSVVVFVTDNVLSLQMISGRSMQPALNPDSNRLWRDVVLVNRMVKSDMTSRLNRGDIVTFTSPFDPNRCIVKRVVALPHDCIVPLGKPDSFVRVPMGHFWAEGDESFHSNDSNSFGPIPLALVDGRVITPIWPPSRFGARIPPLPEWKRPRIFANGSTRLSDLDR